MMRHDAEKMHEVKKTRVWQPALGDYAHDDILCAIFYYGHQIQSRSKQESEHKKGHTVG